MLITVFTPTYNRAYSLTKLYESLVAQSYKKFEWIVVDDGSTDNTAELMSQLIARKEIVIIYEKQNNAGKHAAYNRGVELAKGFLFHEIDSDDSLTPNCLDSVIRYWAKAQELPESQRITIIGVSGYNIHSDRQIIGGHIPYDTLVADLLSYRFKYKIKGDKSETYLTSVLRENPFPIIEGETFLSDALMLYRLADKGFQLLHFNEVNRIQDYLEDGMTMSGLSLIKRGPFGTLIAESDMMGFSKVPLNIKIRSAILFWRFSFWTKNKSFSQKLSLLPNKAFLLFYPVGFLMHQRDKHT